MALPKKIKKTLDLIPKKTGYERRVELLEDIQRDGTYLPKGIGHADLDRGMLDFVKNDLKTFMDGKVIPTVDIIITTQNWSQFTETWNFQDLDKNVKPPFISTVRQPEVPYGTNPSLQYTIPNRKQFYYAKVPTWDGQRKGVDVYKIPQPIPVDITYNVKLFVNRMRSLNEFNKNVLQNFASRQAYTNIKGHYIPIILNNISDESVLDIDRRKYYIQNYEFTMLGFLMDEEEFEVSPGVSRTLTMFEIPQLNKARKVNPQPENPNEFPVDLLFVSGNTELSERFAYTADLIMTETFNVDTLEVYINGDYVGENLSKIQVNTNDLVRFVAVKDSPGEAKVFTTAKLL
jgi:hypothetical protein